MTHIETVPGPTLPRDEVLRDPKTCHLSDDGDHLLVYDPERGSGAIYHRLQQTWLIHSPITPFQWLQALGRRWTYDRST